MENNDMALPQAARAATASRPSPAVLGGTGIANAEYLIRKNGYYYRPKAAGYTSAPSEAGRFTLDEAIKHSHPNGPDGPRDGIDYLPAPASLPGSDHIALGSLDYRVSWPRAATSCDLIPLWAGEFRDHADWVNFATKRLTGTCNERGEVKAICVDALGRRCHDGGDMARARDEGAFPVRYFWECVPAKAMEARRATTGTGVVHDSAVPQGFARSEAPAQGNQP